jgi:hypothetical protein
MALYQFALNTYAGDGKCHNAEPGTFNHECGKPATFLGTNGSAFRTGFCDRHASEGSEAKGMRLERIVSRTTDSRFAYVVTQPDTNVPSDYRMGRSEPLLDRG